MRVENWVRGAVQISLRVADRRGGRETEVEGADPENSQTVG